MNGNLRRELRLFVGSARLAWHLRFTLQPKRQRVRNSIVAYHPFDPTSIRYGPQQREAFGLCPRVWGTGFNVQGRNSPSSSKRLAEEAPLVRAS